MYYSLFALAFFSAVKYSFSSLALIDAEIKPNEPIPTKAIPGTPFIIFRKSLNIIDAETACAITVGRMAVFPDEATAKLVIEEIAKLSEPYSQAYDDSFRKFEFGMDRRYWIGLSDLSQEGDWTWMSDGEKLDYPAPWYEGQPDHLKSGRLEHCVSLWNPIYYENEHHSWNDESCEHKLYFICEDLTI